MLYLFQPHQADHMFDPNLWIHLRKLLWRAAQSGCSEMGWMGFWVDEDEELTVSCCKLAYTAA